MDDDMNARLTILETRIETILPTLATKGDVADAMAAIADVKASAMAAIVDVKASIIMWVTLVTVSVAALNVGVMALMLNRALPVQPAQQPQIIIVPQQPASPLK